MSTATSTRPDDDDDRDIGPKLTPTLTRARCRHQALSKDDIKPEVKVDNNQEPNVIVDMNLISGSVGL
ncbi:hypothetical protein RIF29_13647 [Crotalaria pallida]|uniref:Uncharacterized protein n=1 Tax=Crotalaria pallida TaxID=3830 RepID=A0AAN9IPK4_CROPI